MSCHACFLQPPPPQHSIPSLLCHHCPNRSLIRRCDVCYHASDQAGWMLYRPLGPGRGAGCPGWGCVVMARCRGGLGPAPGSGVLVHTGLHLFVCNIIMTYQITCPCPSIITSSKTGNHCFFHNQTTAVFSGFMVFCHFDNRLPSKPPCTLQI